MTDEIVRIEIQGVDRLQRLLDDAAARAQDLTPAMKEVAGIMSDAVEEEFAQQGRVEKWEGLRPSTKARREKQGKWPGSILQVEGTLAMSVHTESDRTHAVAGTNLKYATTMHFGAKKGEFGKDKHGRPLPWGDIAARPFLRLAPEDIIDMENAVETHILGAFKP